jgi:hypothetical protein
MSLARWVNDLPTAFVLAPHKETDKMVIAT